MRMMTRIFERVAHPSIECYVRFKPRTLTNGICSVSPENVNAMIWLVFGKGCEIALNLLCDAPKRVSMLS